MKKLHFSSIAEHHSALGIRLPEHPLLDVIRISSAAINQELTCQSDISLSNDFYVISLKKITSGEIYYGRTQYDCSSGTMIFTAPRQEMHSSGVKIDSTAISLIIHEDFIQGHPIKDRLRKYRFFDYSTHEALHLSPNEEDQINALLSAIETETQNNRDEFTKELILSQVDTILRYADRFYHRQFLLRKENNTATVERFEQVFETLLENHEGIPEIDTIATALNMTSRYLSDSLKAETGKTAKENIHLKLMDIAKDRLLASNDSVATIAYQMGFEYPQYFARLFKKKVGMTPTEYRQRH
ncbi:helix-turn-helix domain-containing protein [Bacterioplanoides sp.]|uniref:helix-turn-helix domain-containing protein n=1 Tax=Bacterioplanoides sp. TaxID=2066072 RepID=UPI003B008751